MGPSLTCPRCHAPVPAGGQFCAYCGSPVSPSGPDDVTTTAGPTVQARSPGRTPTPEGWLGAPAGAGQGRFTPGSILADRYRIVALLGRGGMGEVYRAEDLRLGQPVAMKFLPPRLAHDAKRLAQLHNEVRTARQVSHPNVCRVYDIGDMDGQLFLTMEYVDGEDLAASLRRVGRFAEDRAIEIARELCAGLAAAHDRGVTHRDLKPANVMIDGAGHVRIMDFGLAVIGATQDERAGTPAYMAPEQVEGRATSAQSDLYSIGLVLYELFTGRRAFTAATLAELVHQQASGEVTAPSDIVPTLSPVIERVILRCLEREPARRPNSALAVAASLPGGDPLAQAIAEGHTPSPEMVAAAGAAMPSMSWLRATAWLAALLALLWLVGRMTDRATVAGRAGLTKPAAVLAEYARQARALAAGGRAAGPIAHEAYGFTYDIASLDWAAAHGQPVGPSVPIRFWYRTSDRPIDPIDPVGDVSPLDPPLTGPGDALVELDTDARLLRFVQRPAVVMPRGPAGRSPDWPAFFRASGLDIRAFAPAPPRRTPPFYASTAVAWTGRVNETDAGVRRVEAAALDGGPVAFEAIAPWSASASAAAPAPRTLASAAEGASAAISVVLVVCTIWLAITNVRAERADRDAAFRVAGFGFAIQVLRWLLQPAHSANPTTEAFRLYMGLGYGLLFAFLLGGAYLGLEPFVRRYWPRALVGWTRLLSGARMDPVVGRDLLIGATIGLIGPVILLAYPIVLPWLGWSAPPGWLLPLSPAAGAGGEMPQLLFTVNFSLLNGLLGLFIVAVVRRVVKPAWLVVLLAMVVFGLLGDPSTSIEFGRPRVFAVLTLSTLPMAFVLVRFGLLAGVAAALASNLVSGMIFTLDPARAYFHTSLVQAGVIASVALVGWWLAGGGVRRAVSPGLAAGRR